MKLEELGVRIKSKARAFMENNKTQMCYAVYFEYDFEYFKIEVLEESNIENAIIEFVKGIK